MSPQSFIEANSLSGLTQLAGNPPKYPRNPTEQARASLVLYIVRVPGTKDIILTTLRPQLKNVSSEDIASSLYYLHLNSDEDAQLVPDKQPIPSRTASKSSRITRKPVADSRGTSLDIDRQSILNSERPRPQVPALDIHQEDISESDAVVDLGGNATETPLVAKPNIARRPVDSKTPARAHTVNRKPLSMKAPRAPAYGEDGQSMNDPETSRRPPSTHTMFEYSTPIEEPGGEKAFSVTIIRRDPSSGGQWNIGIVEGKSNPPTGRSPSKKPYYDISLHITTPGYMYFRYPHANGHATQGGTAPHQGSHGNSSQFRGNEGTSPIAPKAGGFPSGFHRQVSMEWATTWNKTFKQHRRAISDLSTRTKDTSGSSDGPHQSDPEFRGTEVSENSRAKGYTFMSPWGGTCRFSTGGAGRSLRCRHKLPAPVSADAHPTSGSVTVSELRFNLPSADLFSAESLNAAATQVKNGSSKLSKKLDNFRKRLSASKPKPSSDDSSHPTSYADLHPSDDDSRSHLPPRPSSISSNYDGRPTPVAEQLDNFLDELATAHDNEDRLDLSIGQEKAGGGNRGKRAKMGKLIIHDEGLKMMDLIVAANIGVWWTIWSPN